MRQRHGDSDQWVLLQVGVRNSDALLYSSRAVDNSYRLHCSKTKESFKTFHHPNHKFEKKDTFIVLKISQCVLISKYHYKVFLNMYNFHVSV